MIYVFEIDVEREDDGRFIADIPELPGVMAYGATREEAIAACNGLLRERLTELTVENLDGQP